MHTLGRHNIVEVVLTAVNLIMSSLVMLNGALRLIVNCLMLLLFSWVHLISALMFLYKARIQQDHSLVHDFKM